MKDEQNSKTYDKTEEDIQKLQNELIRQYVISHTPIIREDFKVGRNDICPYCNSGKKFKNCECYKHYPKYTQIYQGGQKGITVSPENLVKIDKEKALDLIKSIDDEQFKNE